MKKTRKFVNVVGMRKVLKSNTKIAGITEVEGKEYIFIADGYRIYADLTSNFDSRLYKHILDTFGQELKNGQTLIKKDDKLEVRDNYIASIVIEAIGLKEKQLEVKKIIDMDNTKYQTLVTDKGNATFNKNFLESVRVDEYTVIAGKGGEFDPIVIYKPMQTDFYYLLPVRQSEETKEELSRKTKTYKEEKENHIKKAGLVEVKKDYIEVVAVNKKKKEELQGFEYLFSKAANIADLKRLYKRAIKIYHPDRGGSIEDAQDLGRAYQKRYDELKEKASIEDIKQYKENPEEFTKIFYKLMSLEDLSIDIVGSWIWISGDTKKHKEALKALKLRYSGAKKMWYWFDGIGKAKRKASSKKSYKDIKDTYGAVSFKSGQDQRVEA